MPKDHSSKARSLELSSRIRDFGRPSSSPCNRCFRRGSDCLIHLSSSRCSNCIKSRVSCRLMPSVQEFNKAAVE
ncbi:hypothetical protein K491DRAFT_616232 [Lophiostoma macrostomum CBS 122681]|uniref:Zn(2)-C6 fungal-type domain-containing protein n=1 Tax=Lophiostoma macrostomum CBS 122681 TaxID=1314788 RepID=A0A6A6SGQ5_9PLEO|nr:hypothetical protein K491DRAFT_616232 [Lophiostoma macrostomum CBS 122681]